MLWGVQAIQREVATRPVQVGFRQVNGTGRGRAASRAGEVRLWDFSIVVGERDAWREIAKIQKRLEFHKITLEYDDSVKEFLINEGFTPEYGARPLRRVVERYIEDQLAEEILRQNFKNDSKIRIELDGNKLLFFPEDKPKQKKQQQEKVPVKSE